MKLVLKRSAVLDRDYGPYGPIAFFVFWNDKRKHPSCIPCKAKGRGGRAGDGWELEEMFKICIRMLTDMRKRTGGRLNRAWSRPLSR